MPFQKGKSGNPHGRRPVGTTVADYVRQLAGPNAKTYVDHLHRLATEPHDNPRLRIMAIDVLLERGWGKPPQDVNLDGQFHHHYDLTATLMAARKRLASYGQRGSGG